MVRRPPRLRSGLWFIAVTLVAMGFPLQVFAGAPYPALLPYVLVVLIVLMTLFSPARRVRRSSRTQHHPGIRSLVSAFLLAVLFNTGWQVAFGYVSPFEGASALTIYVLPIVFYWYFRQVASEREIRAALWAIASSGLVIGVYFAYDSYLKLALGQVSSYARAAVDYAASRGGQVAGSIDLTRATPVARAYGLMETHAVSGTWTVLGAVASVSLLDSSRRTLRRVVLAIFGGMLFAGLNTTTILAYIVVLFVVEFNGVDALRNRTEKGAGRKILIFGISLLLVLGAVVLLSGDAMSAFIARNLATQSQLVFGTGPGTSMIGIFLNNAWSYLAHIADLPLTLVLGDGFTSYGGAKGGDVSLIETLERFGLPLYASVVYGTWRLLRNARRYSRRSDLQAENVSYDARQLVWFATCVTVLIAVTEIHYTVWSTKSVLPVLFFTLALYERYLPADRTARTIRTLPMAESV